MSGVVKGASDVVMSPSGGRGLMSCAATLGMPSVALAAKQAVVIAAKTAFARVFIEIGQYAKVCRMPT
ncbi:hypothetical protein GCM10011410_17600 [Hoyosella rhizosphaerae]|uniref:Uncharacterized protein n=1 Tax=Hoyosella rhizosphaerae TaxID=1755582 RepID=A0A916XEC5_9ACTN|nr:hypothetical protein GCM10011410_17600 [Hoyosella rhizosphaerae]